MTLRRRRLLQLTFAIPLAGCGLQPLYATRPGGEAGVAEQLAQVQVPEQQTRPGQLVRNQLLTIMQGHDGAARYTLELVIREGISPVSTLPGTATVRYQYNLTGKYKLKQNGDGKNLVAGSIFSQVQYDTLRQPVADLQAKRDAMERAATELAHDIRLRIAAYFSSRTP
jgi:LPS-assembly lipoprotein